MAAVKIDRSIDGCMWSIRHFDQGFTLKFRSSKYPSPRRIQSVAQLALVSKSRLGGGGPSVPINDTCRRSSKFHKARLAQLAQRGR